MNGTQVVLAGIRAAGNRGVRLLIALGIAFSIFLLWLLLALFPGTGPGTSRPADLVRELAARDDPTLSLLFLVFAGILLWAVWSLISGAALRSAVLSIRGEPVTVLKALNSAIRHWTAYFFAPIALITWLAAGTALVYALVSLTRVPAVGWPIFLLLSPVAFLVALAVVNRFARWLIGGHLTGPAIAAGHGSAFAALGLANAYARRAPVKVVLYHLLAMLLVVLHASWRVLLVAAAVGLTGLFLNWRDTSVLAEICTWPILLAVASWLLAWPVSLCLGSRAGLYLMHKKELDGREIAAAENDPERLKSLEELGFELVQRLRVCARITPQDGER